MQSESDLLDGIIDTSFAFQRAIRSKMCIPDEDGGKLQLLQLHSLALIEEKGTITMKELAEHMRVTPPTATSLANRLVKMELLGRKHDPKNRRTVRLSLTLKGKKLLQKLFKRHRIQMRNFFANLSNQDQKDLLRILKSLLEGLSKM